MKKRIVTISVTYTNVLSSRGDGYFCNEGIKYKHFIRKVLKCLRSKEGAVRSTWGQRALVSEGFKEERAI